MLVANCRSCQVCGAQEAKNHYGGIVCSACRIFFIRCIKMKLPEPCLKRNNCKIDSKSRNFCNNCRFRRCGAVMNPELVGLRRNGTEKSVVPLLLHEHIDYCLGFYHPTLYLKGPVIVPGAIETIYNFHKLSLNEAGPSPSVGKTNINVSLDEVLLDPEICSERITAGFENRCRPNNPAIKYSMPAAFCRGLVTFVDFLRFTQYFNQLNDDDKVGFVIGKGLQRITEKFAEYKLQGNVSPKQWITIGQRYNISSPLLAKITKTTFLWMENIQDLFDQGRIPDEIEFIYMKLIAAFTCRGLFPTKFKMFLAMNCSQQGIQLINSVRETYITKLCEYITDAYCHLPRSEQLQRLSTLLEIMRGVKESSRLYQLFYTELAVTGTGNMRGRLALDVTLLE